MKFHGLSDVGVSRANNEDVWLALPELGFFALADGMGGHQAGEVAAKETIEHLARLAPAFCIARPIEEMQLRLRQAIEETNRHVFAMGRTASAYYGMGTTLCCLLWVKEHILYAHVGDSRIYRMRKGKLALLTQDHSLLSRWLATGKLAEECTTPYPYKHVITRAIGCSDRANPEIALCTPEMDDLYLLCTDGLSDVLTATDMEAILERMPALEERASALIAEAKLQGSSDNMTVLLVQRDADLL